VKFGLTTEQESLRDVLRSVTREATPTEDALTTEARGQFWKVLADDIGLSSMLLPESHGGIGAGSVELVVAARGLGRSLLGGTLLAQVAAVDLLTRVTDPDEGWWKRIDDGELLTAAFGPSDVQATKDGGRWRLSGRIALIPEVDIADTVLVVADTTDGRHLFAIPAASVVSAAIGDGEGVDLTRAFATSVLDAVEVDELIGQLADTQTGATVLLVLAAEALGGAEQCLQMTLDYTKSRNAFGRPVASFQAVKHRLADVYTGTSAGEALLLRAAWAADAGTSDSEALVAAALQWCADAFGRAARTSIQLHGGIGFTWEHAAHYYLRRALAIRGLLAHVDTASPVLDSLGHND
jgi:alkylation response protein AidB-like acyl-CoA dehydrogenase